MKFCHRPFKHAYLADKGEVWPCSWMHFVIGNLYEQDLDEIWHSEAAQKARESILDGSFAFCRKTSCPYCERDELPDLTEEEIVQAAVPAPTPVEINMANDHICNGGGEVLANPSFIKFLEKLRPVHEDFQLGFETNGVLFDEAHWQRFAHLGNYHLSATVTINSIRRETYRYLSGGFDHLERVLNNMRFLSRLRRENKLNKLSVTIVVQECNFWEVPEYIDLFAHSKEFEVDAIVMKPLYKWWHMAEETYWFKNILNPLHPYHKEYLKILADDCWKDPKVYDWGCHNIRHAAPHPLSQEKIYNRLLLDIYQNETGLSPSEFLRSCMERMGGKRVGYYGKNDFSKAMVKMLRDAGIDVAFQITWAKEEDDGGPISKVARQEFRPDMADVMLIIDFHKGHYWFQDLPVLGFQGPVVSIEEFIEGKKQ